MGPFDVVVVGGGIVGMATGRALAERGRSVVVLEAESGLARHQSGRNSGVIHAGLYYRPGSLKARLCAAGRERLYRFCERRGIEHRRCGKLVVAKDERDLAALAELERRAAANGLRGVERLDAGGIRHREPAARGVAALWVPATGVVDFAAVTCALAEELQAAGGEVRLRARLRGVERGTRELALRTGAGELRARFLVNCAGLQCDRVARLCGLRPGVRIVPFRGEYFELLPERRALVRGLVYPVPDPRFPFLGVHCTRTIGDRVLLGPNAVLALRREGYRRASFSPGDTVELLAFPGFWRLAWRLLPTAAGEMRRSLSRAAFVEELQRLVPAIRTADLRRAPAGVRAQAVDAEGGLLDDFHIEADERTLHLLNAPSPAATSALAVADELAGRVERAFGLGLKAP